MGSHGRLPTTTSTLLEHWFDSAVGAVRTNGVPAFPTNMYQLQLEQLDFKNLVCLCFLISVSIEQSACR